MTAGELIDAAIEATIDKLTEGTMDANVIRGVSFDLEKALPALWSAEVRECVVDDSDAAAPMQLVTPERHGLDLWGMGLRHNDRVRVIVVPLKE